jgi:hypothetical protein
MSHVTGYLVSSCVADEEAVMQVERGRSRGAGTALEAEMGVAWRILLVVIGFAVATAGWTLVMTAILSFIGLPLFIFGLALMQSAERG